MSSHQALAAQGSHQMRVSEPSVPVSRAPVSTRSMSREWMRRRESGSVSASECALTTGVSLSRIALRSSSSLTVCGRPPAPIRKYQPSQVISGPETREQQVQDIATTGRNSESQSLQGISEIPARTSARDWLSEEGTMKAITTNGLESIEFSGENEPCEQSTACGALQEGAQ